MPLTFIDKKKRWPPSKPIQYILAGFALVGALAILAAWLFLRFVYTDPTKDPNENNDAPQTEVVLPGIGYCVIILEDDGLERFALIKADPSSNAIALSPLDPSTQYKGSTLSSILHKSGATQVVSAISALLDVPVSHYFSFSVDNILDIAVDLGDNLPFILAEEVVYQDENLTTVHLSAEKHNLTPKQIAAILRYTQWESSDNYTALFADLTVAFINHYMRPDCPLSRYFQMLTETSATNIRIDNYNAYQYGLEHLSSINTGSLATLLS